MIRVEFYTKPDGKSPIEEFLRKCNTTQEAKILRQLQYLHEFGLTSVIPNLKKLKGTELWELRILGKDNIRIICVKITKKTIMVVHIFVKKKRKTPAKELQIAIKRYQGILDK